MVCPSLITFCFLVCTETLDKGIISKILIGSFETKRIQTLKETVYKWVTLDPQSAELYVLLCLCHVACLGIVV